MKTLTNPMNILRAQRDALLEQLEDILTKFDSDSTDPDVVSARLLICEILAEKKL